MRRRCRAIVTRHSDVTRWPMIERNFTGWNYSSHMRRGLSWSDGLSKNIIRDLLIKTILIKVKSLVIFYFNGARGSAERNDLKRSSRVARCCPRRHQLAERFDFAITREKQIANQLFCRSH